MLVDLWTISHPADYSWLRWMFRSIDKYVTGFRKLVLVLEEQDDPPDELPSYVEVKRCRNYRGTGVSGYYGQSIEGLRAHTYTDADVILFCESDWVFSRPFNVLSDKHMSVDPPVIFWRPWESAGPAACWRDGTEAVLGSGTPGECGCDRFFAYPTAFIARCWEHLGPDAEGRLVEAIRKKKNVSQFNILGNYAMMHEPQTFRLHNVIADGWPGNTPIRGFWSRDGANSPGTLEALEKYGVLP